MAITEAGRLALDKLRVSDPRQLDLDLPWNGRSPRALTKGAEIGRLRSEAATLNEADAVIDEQYRRFLHGS